MARLPMKLRRPGSPPLPVPPIVIGRSDRIDPLKLFAFNTKPDGFARVSRTVPEWTLKSYVPPFAIAPEYSTPPLTDLALSRSHVTSVADRLPLIELRSSACTLTDFAWTLPLMLLAARSPSVDTPDSVTLPETLLASSILGVSVAVTSPLIVSSRTVPRAPVIFKLPETEWRSTAAPGGTTMV